MIEISTAWEIVEPGLIRIPTTNVCVRRHHDGYYLVEWNSKPVIGRAYYMTLDAAKIDSYKFLKELYNMGYDA